MSIVANSSVRLPASLQMNFSRSGVIRRATSSRERVCVGGVRSGSTSSYRSRNPSNVMPQGLLSVVVANIGDLLGLVLDLNVLEAEYHIRSALEDFTLQTACAALAVVQTYKLLGHCLTAIGANVVAHIAHLLSYDHSTAVFQFRQPFFVGGQIGGRGGRVRIA